MKGKQYKLNQINIFQIFETTTLTTDLDTEGQDAHLTTEGSKVAETDGEKTADEGNEVLPENNIMDEMAEILTTEGPNI